MKGKKYWHYWHVDGEKNLKQYRRTHIGEAEWRGKLLRKLRKAMYCWSKGYGFKMH